MGGRKQSGDTTRHSFFDTRLPAERFGVRVWYIRAMCASVLPFQNPIFYDFDIFITIILIQLSSHFFLFRHSHSFRHNPHHSTPPSLLPPSRSLFIVIFNCLFNDGSVSCFSASQIILLLCSLIFVKLLCHQEEH